MNTKLSYRVAPIFIAFGGSPSQLQRLIVTRRALCGKAECAGVHAKFVGQEVCNLLSVDHIIHVCTVITCTYAQACTFY